MTAASRAPGALDRGLLGCRILGAVALALVAVAALTPAVEWLATRYAEPARLAPADAIVVLGGDFRPDGWLDTASLRRLVHGILLYRQGLAPLLVLSGTTPPAGPSEPEVRARLARELGVPSAAILPVIGANTTREEAVRVRAELQAAGHAVHPARERPAPPGPRPRGVRARRGSRSCRAGRGPTPLTPESPGAASSWRGSSPRRSLGWLYYRLAGIRVTGARPGGASGCATWSSSRSWG